MSSGGYGQSANYCSATLVQGTAIIAGSGTSASATFQQTPQSEDSVIVGCLGEQSTPFTVTDNEQIMGYCNAPNCDNYILPLAVPRT
jgi:hypothetical protein